MGHFRGSGQTGLHLSQVQRSTARLRHIKLIDEHDVLQEPEPGIFVPRKVGEAEQDVWRNRYAYFTFYFPAEVSDEVGAVYSMLKAEPSRPFSFSYLSRGLRIKRTRAAEIIRELERTNLMTVQRFPMGFHVGSVVDPKSKPQWFVEHEAVVRPASPKAKPAVEVPTGDAFYFYTLATKDGIPHKLSSEIAEMAVNNGLKWKAINDPFTNILKDAREQHSRNGTSAHHGFLVRHKVKDFQAVTVEQVNQNLDQNLSPEVPTKLPPKELKYSFDADSFLMKRFKNDSPLKIPLKVEKLWVALGHGSKTITEDQKVMKLNQLLNSNQPTLDAAIAELVAA